MNNPVNIDTSGLRNRLNQAKVDKDNKSDNEFEFEQPSIVSLKDVDANDCENEVDSNNENESINLIDLTTDLNAEVKKNKTVGEHAKRSSLSTSNTKFGADNNFRFNFQMPKLISTPDKVDENSDNFFLDTVHTPSKRLQAEDTDNKHKKARLADNNCQPNWRLITMATFSITLILAVVKIFLILWRNEYLI